MLVIAKVRLPELLDLSIRDLLLTCDIHLYKNNVTPTINSVLADFTEADFTGYAAQPLDAWSSPFLNGDNNGEVSHPIIEWDCTAGSNSIYGYYVTDDLGAYLYAERNTAGPVTVSTGVSYFVLPRFTDKNQT